MLNIVLYIESAIGLIYLKDILQHASELSEISRGVIDAVVFGSDDFTANIGQYIYAVQLYQLLFLFFNNTCGIVVSVTSYLNLPKQYVRVK